VIQRCFDQGASYTIVFDGGALGNPGLGYGSYKILLNGGETVIAHERREYGDNVTNNQAEYRTLIEALDDLNAKIGQDVQAAHVAVYSDSLLVVSQLQGKWKVKNSGLRPLYQEALEKLGRFRSHTLQWHDRSNSVRTLGH
jgi:ribonuclease HI